MRLTRAVHRRSADPDYLFAASFGSRCLGQAWKKESLGLDPMSQQPCAPSTHNIWPDYGRPLKWSAIVGPFAAHLQPGGVIAQKKSSFISGLNLRHAQEAFDDSKDGNNLSQPLFNRGAKQVKRKRPNKKENRLWEREERRTHT